MELPYKDFFDAVPGYLTVQDRDLKIIAANERFHQDFGDFEGRYCYQVYKHRAERCDVCPVMKTFTDGQRHSSEETVTCVNGTEVSVLVYTKPIRDKNGEITSVLEMSTDVTEMKSLQKRLRASQQRYHTLFEEVPCYISVQDRELNIYDSNKALQETFGRSLGRKCYEIYKRRDEECYPCMVQDTFNDGKRRVHEEVVTSKDGRLLNVLVHTAPIRNPEGEISGVMEMGADITRIRELQSQLTSIGLLISSISHGLKGLINGLDGGIYLVNNGLKKDNPARVEKGWDIVLRNVGRIRSMVLDILYYAKDREPNWEHLSAAAVMEEVRGVIADKAAEQSVELQVTLDPETGDFEADAKAVRTLLINLAENSLDACRLDKKDSGHKVTLGVRGGIDHVRFEIEDNGIGMDGETREKAFSLFFSSKGGEGTGLGLFISNKIAQAHGGSITLDSESGKGTRFIVSLPRNRPMRKEDGAKGEFKDLGVV